MMIKKKRIFNILLPLFPENESLRKHRWHKPVKIVTIIISATSLYSILWLAATFFLIPQSWFDNPLEKLLYYPAYIPLNITNYLSRFPIYGTVFHGLANVPPFGPMTLIVILSLIYFITPTLVYRLAIYISQRYYLKKVKIAFFAVLLIIGLFVFSTWKYQHLIDQDSIIADEQSLKVNPLIIQRKNSYINSMKIIQASGSADEYWTETNKYLDFSKKYIAAQKTWLFNQNTFMKRRDFAFFIPTYMRKAAQLQYDSREAGMKATSAIVVFFESYKNLDANQQKTLSNTILDETKKSNDADDAYNKLYDSSKGKFDLRNYFTTVPQTTCPPENFNIPNVPDMLNPKTIPSNSPLG